MWCWGYNLAALEDLHGDAYVSAKECTKPLNKYELERTLYVAFEGTPKISL